MIKFFRKIRQKLLSENKFSKYLIYAIGEIILVVIGILIALQINNWNENRKRSNEELSILKDLKKGLEADLSDLNYNVNCLTLNLSVADKVISHLKSDEPYNDSVAIQFGKMMFPYKFVYSTSAFETLKSKGLDLIKNQKLRDAIVEVYDSRYKFFTETEKTILLDEVERGYQNVFSTRFEESFVVDFSKKDYGLWLKPLDFEALKTDKEFLYYIKSYRNRLHVFINFHYKGVIIVRVENLINFLEKEITNFEQ
ncbi:DUF6090 family protein [Psychroserpens algicola]|uniref:DUF6090 family protein n=1 Tax=Psychroserpens algicola TaxID=1719034 RepID=UPI001953974D|nr:DUF6090 family protein [Psychroserpens algicola]